MAILLFSDEDVLLTQVKDVVFQVKVYEFANKIETSIVQYL